MFLFVFSALLDAVSLIYHVYIDSEVKVSKKSEKLSGKIGHTFGALLRSLDVDPEDSFELFMLRKLFSRVISKSPLFLT